MKIINPEGKKTIYLKKNEEWSLFIEDFLPGNRNYTLTVIHEEENSKCTITGRIQSQKKERKKWTITQIFKGKNQKGFIDLKGVAEDESFLQFDGSAKINSSAIKSEAHVQEKIMLFGEAQGYMLPVLTVQTYDVSAASHSASIAPVELQKILYLQSRGFPQKKAEKIIKEGFLK